MWRDWQAVAELSTAGHREILMKSQCLGASVSFLRSSRPASACHHKLLAEPVDPYSGGAVPGALPGAVSAGSLKFTLTDMMIAIPGVNSHWRTASSAA